MKKSTSFGLVLLLVIAFAIALVFGLNAHYHSRQSAEVVVEAPTPVVATSTPLAPAELALKSYTSTKYDFEIKYPGNIVLKENYVYTAFGPDTRIPGVSFTLPKDDSKGTNLSEAVFSIEVDDTNTSCNPADFLSEADLSTRVSSKTKNNIVYKVASTSGAGAGNLYEETIYSTKQNGTCYGIRYFIHSTNIGNYDPGTVKEYDKEKVLTTFDEMFSTITFVK